MAPALEKSKKSLSTVLFLTVPGGGMARTRRACRTADWILAFLSLHVIQPSSWGKGFPFPPPFGIIVYESKPSDDKPRLQVPCRGRRPAGTAASATTLHWHDRVKGCMSQSPASYFLPVVQPLPRFFLLRGVFLNHPSCWGAGFLRRKGTVQ